MNKSVFKFNDSLEMSHCVSFWPVGSVRKVGEVSQLLYHCYSCHATLVACYLVSACQAFPQYLCLHAAKCVLSRGPKCHLCSKPWTAAAQISFHSEQGYPCFGSGSEDVFLYFISHHTAICGQGKIRVAFGFLSTSVLTTLGGVYASKQRQCRHTGTFIKNLVHFQSSIQCRYFPWRP